MRFDNSDKTLIYLKEHTGLEWEQITPVYLHFKTHYNPHKQFCVASTPDWIRKGPLAKFYIPQNGEDLHNPNKFLEYSNKKEKNLVERMPATVVDLGNLPSISRTIPGIEASGFTSITYTIKYTGKLILRKLNSLSTLTVGLGNSITISSDAYIAANEYISKLSVDLDIISKSVSITAEDSSKLGTTSMSLTMLPPDNLKITTEMIPSPNVFGTTFNGWIIDGEVGYSLSGEASKSTHPSPPGAVLADPSYSTSLSTQQSVQQSAVAETVLVVFLIMLGAPVGC